MEPSQTYPWMELAALLPNGNMHRHQYTQINDDKAVNQWRQEHDNTDIFTSISQYAQPDSTAAYINPLFFDIDSVDDLIEAREAALQLCGRLIDKAFIPQESLELFFSGHKGFHIIVPCEVFQPFSCLHIFAFNKKLAEIAAANIRFLDLSVYTTKRLWRLVNSRHRQSRLYKIPLAYEELRDLSMDGILHLAQKPRPDDSYARVELCLKTRQWFRQAIRRYEIKCRRHLAIQENQTLFAYGWRMPPCIKSIETAVIPDGMRHTLYLVLSRYYRFLNMHPDEILDCLCKIDARHPIHDPDSIERIVKFGCEHPGFPGCSNPALVKYCQKEKCFYTKLKSKPNDRNRDIQKSVFLMKNNWNRKPQ